MASRTAFALVALVLPSALASAQLPTQRWIRQVGTSQGDHLYAAAPDGSGGVFVGGPVSVVGGPFNAIDSWLTHFDAAGNLAWSIQFGTIDIDALFAATSDGAGGVLSAGYTDGTLTGPNAGGYDAFVLQHDGAGNLLGGFQLGSAGLDFATAVASDGAGGGFFGGYTTGDLGAPNVGNDDAWVAHFVGSGSVAWIRQMGTMFGDKTKAIVADGAGGLFACGETFGPFAGPNVGYADGWLARIDAFGGVAWSVQIGTDQFDHAYAVLADGAGGVFVAGDTAGALGGPARGNDDVWVARYDAAGARQWLTQLGGAQNDQPSSLALDGCGGLIVCGQLDASLGGSSGDVLIARLDLAGAVLSVGSFGVPSANDKAWIAVADGAGGVFVGGDTFGALAGPHQGGVTDGWVGRFRPCDGAFDFADARPHVESRCAGDGSVPGLAPCPCANFGASGRGCANSVVAAGALLEASGSTVQDTVRLVASGMPASTATIFLKGDAYLASGAVFGDGVRCADGNLIRLATVQASAGSAQVPTAGGASIGTLGQTPFGSGLTAIYQTFYRNAAPAFCPTSASNVTQAIAIRW